MAESKYITIRDAAEELRVSENTIRRMFDKGELGGFRTPSGHRRLLRADVLHLVRSQTTRPSVGLSFE